MTKKTITIGVLSPVTGGSYYGKILAGIAREVAAVGGRVVLVQTLDAGLSSDEVVSAPNFTTPTAWDHLDGVISIATATQRHYLDRLKAAGKAVALASDEIDGFDAPSATPDNATGVADAVHHLIGHGHTRIGFAANLIQPDMRERDHTRIAGEDLEGDHDQEVGEEDQHDLLRPAPPCLEETHHQGDEQDGGEASPGQGAYDPEVGQPLAATGTVEWGSSGGFAAHTLSTRALRPASTPCGRNRRTRTAMPKTIAVE
jgi:hypothetical protein